MISSSSEFIVLFHGQSLKFYLILLLLVDEIMSYLDLRWIKKIQVGPYCRLPCVCTGNSGLMHLRARLQPWNLILLIFHTGTYNMNSQGGIEMKENQIIFTYWIKWHWTLYHITWSQSKARQAWLWRGFARWDSPDQRSNDFACQTVSKWYKKVPYSLPGFNIVTSANSCSLFNNLYWMLSLSE